MEMVDLFLQFLHVRGDLMHGVLVLRSAAEKLELHDEEMCAMPGTYPP